MNISYDKDIDYMEIFFKKENNYGDALSEQVTEFKSEKNDKTIGFGFENASKTVFDSEILQLTVKLAAMLKIIRASKGLTQDLVAKKIDITLRHYQRLEAGEDTTLEVLEKITQAFPDQDFSKMLKKKRSA